jgi:hypothetical protein
MEGQKNRRTSEVKDRMEKGFKDERVDGQKNRKTEEQNGGRMERLEDDWTERMTLNHLNMRLTLISSLHLSLGKTVYSSASSPSK